MWLLPFGLQDFKTCVYTKYGGYSVLLMMADLNLAGSRSPLLIFRQTLRVVNQDLAACFVWAMLYRVLGGPSIVSGCLSSTHTEQYWQHFASSSSIMYLSLETDLMKTVAYIRRRLLQIFTRRLTTNNESADVALGNAVVSTTDVVNTLRSEIHLYNI